MRGSFKSISYQYLQMFQKILTECWGFYEISEVLYEVDSRTMHITYMYYKGDKYTRAKTKITCTKIMEIYNELYNV